MDDIPHQQPNPSHSKTSLPTFARSIPVEITALPASTRTSFTRVDETRPGTAAGDNSNNHLPDGDPVPATGPGDGDGNGRGGGGDGAGAGDARGAPLPPEDEHREEETGAVVPQVPQTLVQFLLVSGRRRSLAFDPETTVGRVKELVWNTWPNGTSSFEPPSTPAAYTCMRRTCAMATRPDSVHYFIFIIYSFFFSIHSTEDRTLPILVNVCVDCPFP